jgi:2-polyprenyl-3-methyl-5-hydroxy-6-metoxy-1,4-benzoquinol methylase
MLQFENMLKIYQEMELPPSPGPPSSHADECLEQCPACAERNILFAWWGRSRYSNEWWGYYHCKSCGLIFVNPRRSFQNVKKVIETTDNQLLKFVNMIPFDFKEFNYNIIQPAIRILPPLSKDGLRRRWLDIGCATGTMLEAAYRQGYEPYGLELNQPMVDWILKNRPHIHMTHGLLNDLSTQEKFDIISADNVLEHIHEPAKFISDIRNHMKHDSLLILRVPNFYNFAFFIYYLMGRQGQNFMVDPIAHPCNYSRRSLMRLLSQSGFKSLRIMEHFMLSYPLKLIMGQRSGHWHPALRKMAIKIYPLTFLFDRLIPRGGVDFTIFARISNQ